MSAQIEIVIVMKSNENGTTKYIHTHTHIKTSEPNGVYKTKVFWRGEGESAKCKEHSSVN